MRSSPSSVHLKKHNVLCFIKHTVLLFKFNCSPVLWYPLGMQDKLHLDPILEHAGRISELQYMLLDHSMHQPNSPSSDCTETIQSYICFTYYLQPQQSAEDSFLYVWHCIIIYSSTANKLIKN